MAEEFQLNYKWWSDYKPKLLPRTGVGKILKEIESLGLSNGKTRGLARFGKDVETYFSLLDKLQDVCTKLSKSKKITIPFSGTAETMGTFNAETYKNNFKDFYEDEVEAIIVKEIRPHFDALDSQIAGVEDIRERFVNCEASNPPSDEQKFLLKWAKKNSRSRDGIAGRDLSVNMNSLTNLFVCSVLEASNNLRADAIEFNRKNRELKDEKFNLSKDISDKLGS